MTGSRRRAVPAAVLAALALALPAGASATDYTVNSVGDQSDLPAAGCETSVGNCTLRAAIEASNGSGAERDQINFSALFDGQTSSTITPATALPTITAPVEILSVPCARNGGLEFGPCVGVNGPAGAPVLKVEADETAIYNLSLTGGFEGIYVAGSGAFVQENWIGLKLDRTAGTNSSRGVSIAPGSDAVVGNNEILATSGSTGIESQGAGAKILENTITGAYNGIWLHGDTGGKGNLIEGNTVSGSARTALAIQNNDNLVFGNRFEGAPFSTVFLEGNADGNRIGGDSAASENFFKGSTYSPIAMVGADTTQNEVARNRGEANGGNFILVSNQNGGIKPPVIATALQSSAAGSAEPGAKVRVFRKAIEEPGEIESFLGDAVADGGGKWTVAYPGQIPTGTYVSASQTNTEGGTSELAVATSAADPPAPPSGGGGSGSSGGGGAGSGNTEAPAPAPETTIAKVPKLTGAPTAKFKFTATIAGSSFECKLDKGKFKQCRSPQTYKKLKPGRHVFTVRAKSPAGVVDPTPATKKFTVSAG